MARKAGGVSILVIDIGTSGVRAAVVRPDGTVAVTEHRPALPATPFPGLVEFDARLLSDTAARTPLVPMSMTRMLTRRRAPSRAASLPVPRRQAPDHPEQHAGHDQDHDARSVERAVAHHRVDAPERHVRQHGDAGGERRVLHR